MDRQKYTWESACLSVMLVKGSHSLANQAPSELWRQLGGLAEKFRLRDQSTLPILNLLYPKPLA